MLSRLAVPLILGSLLLVGCGTDPAPDPAAPPAPAPAAGFVLVSSSGDVYQDQRSLRLQFSEQLDNRQDLDPLLNVLRGVEPVSGSWMLHEDGDQLIFPFVEPDQSYRVRVSANLLSADGTALGQDLDLELSTHALEPSVSFASRGSVLPSHRSEGLPIVVLNVPEVDVEFFRVDPLQLPRFLNHYDNSGREGWWQLRRVPEWATSVYANRFATGATDNQRRVSHLPVQQIEELKTPGLYLAVMKRAGHFNEEFQTSHFFVSDIGVHVRLYPDSTEMLVASLESGKPLADVELELLDLQGRRLASVRSNSDGAAHFERRPAREEVLIARHGGDLSVVAFKQPALDLSEFPVSGPVRRDLELFAFSGRDLYRPGETLRMHGLLRDSDGRAVPGQPVFASLIQPDGRVFEQRRLSPEDGGFLSWQRTLPDDVPLGRWRVEFRVDPEAAAIETLNLRVEEFLPERLKLELDSPQQQLSSDDRALQLHADAQYLYGAPAAGNRATARLVISPASHPIETLPDWYFGDGTLATLNIETAMDAVLGDDGTLQQALPLPDAMPAGSPLQVAVEVSVFESGGRAINRRLQRNLLPADALVAVRPLFEDDQADARSNAGFEVIRVNPSGERLDSSELKLSLLRENREFHWSHDPQGGWRQDFTARIETVENRSITLAADRSTRVDLPVQWGEYRLQIIDPDTGLTLVYPFIAGWSWGEGNRGLDARPDRVKLALDKERYQQGDTLSVTLTPPHSGPGWLLIESDRLLHSQRIDNAHAGQVIELTLDPSWDRHDLYMSVVVLRPGSDRDTLTPSRALGVTHIPMDRRDRSIDLSIVAPAQAAPGDRITVELQSNGSTDGPTWVTVSAVDQGILNITGYPLPDAAARFFGQRRLIVEAVDLYGRIIEYMQGVSASLRYGGDASLQGLPQARRPTAEVRTVDLFHGPVQFDDQGQAQVQFDIPDFNGSLRLAALAYDDTRYGKASTALQVRAPLLIEVSTPRVLAPGDRSQLTVDVGNFSGQSGRFVIEVDSQGALNFEAREMELDLADGQRQVVNFGFTAENDHALARFTVEIRGAGQSLQRHFSIPVRAPWLPERRSSLSTLQPGQSMLLDETQIKSWLSSSAQTRLTLSSRPPLPVAAAAEALISYPYGCLEQTTSRALPLIWLDATALQTLGLGEQLSETDRRTQLDNALARISGMQMASGHFSAWSGSSQAAQQMTPYVTDFLLSAREAGFTVPEAVLQKALQRLAEDLQAGGHRFWGYDHADHLHLAHAAWSGYVLARVQRAPLAALRRLHDQSRAAALSPLPLTHLGLALAMQGDHARADQALGEAARFEKQRPAWLGDYGSALRDQALRMALLIEHGRDIDDQQQNLLQLAREVAGQRWLSTQEHGAILRLGLAMMKAPPQPWTADLQQGDETRQIDATMIWSSLFDAEALKRRVRVQAGSARLYALVDSVGLAASEPAADDSKIKLTRRWYSPDGQRWEGDTLREGESLIVELEIASSENLSDLLVVDPLPGGLELENPDLGGLSLLGEVQIDGVSLAEAGFYASISHQEFHDDRYAAVIQTYSYNSTKLYYVVRAVSPGEFTVPAVWAEDMYRPEYRGSGESGMRLTVTPP